MAGPGVSAGHTVNEPVELLSIYPTLLELSGLPPYTRNEGHSLVPLIQGESPGNTWYALTTYGMDNHAVRTKDFRYIRYEDGSEELYDHRVDPQGWNNVAQQAKYQTNKKQLKAHLPTTNAPWTKHSSYTFQPYFANQKSRSDQALKE